jgi:hypothetical protein
LATPLATIYKIHIVQFDAAVVLGSFHSL